MTKTRLDLADPAGLHRRLTDGNTDSIPPPLLVGAGISVLRHYEV